MRSRSLACVIHSAIVARQNCLKSGNSFASKWDETLNTIQENLLPSGSGIDNGTTIDLDKSGNGKIVLTCDFHHMTDAGYYDGWTSHQVIVTPTFDGFDLRITGRNINEIKDYLAEVFHSCLSNIVTLDLSNDAECRVTVINAN